MKLTIGLGGGCHWCTEAIFSSLKGIDSVQQGWLASLPPNDALSEGVLLVIDTNQISLRDLIDIHLETHSADKNHSMRSKYRSAVYVEDKAEQKQVQSIISNLAAQSNKHIITQVLRLDQFTLQPNQAHLDYFYKQPDKPFCQTYIQPKLKQLLNTHRQNISEKCLPILQKHR